jgi:hypothetical protein
MYTDLKALAERDKEHLNAWYLEGYKRYVGGVDRGFVLLRTPDRDPEDEDEHEDELELEHEEMTGMKRKRRYTEEPGMLERRRKVLRAALAEGDSAGLTITAKSSAGGDAGGEKAVGGSTKRPAIGGRRPSSLDRNHRRESGGGPPLQASRPVTADNHQSMHKIPFDVSNNHDDNAAGTTYISPLVTPGLAFIPTAYGEISPMSYSMQQGAVGAGFKQAAGAGLGAGVSATATRAQPTSLVGSGFNLVQPPLNRGAMEERRRKARLAATAAVAAATSTLIQPPPPPHARFEVPTQLTMTSNVSSDFARPELKRVSTSAGSLAFVSANQLPIPLPAIGSSPVSMLQQQQQPAMQHHHQHSHSHTSADAALGTSSSAGLTSLTGASLGCLSVKLHDCMTGSSSGLGAPSSLIMTDEDHHHVEPFEDAPTPDLMPSFGLGDEMILELQGNPGDAVEMSGPDSAKSAHGGLGLSSTYDFKTRPTMLQRAASSYLQSDKWSLATPTSEGTTPMDVAWDKWLRADEGSSTPGQYEDPGKGK